MKDNLLFWALIGIVSGITYLKFQQWSVRWLNPQNRRLSMFLIIGGSFLRWLFIAAVFLVALTHSFLALLLVFITFMLIRLVFLLNWQGWLRATK